MAFKKHQWFDYNRSVDTLEVTMKDWNGRVIDSLKCNKREDSSKLILILKKYGFLKTDDRDIQREIEEERNWLDKEREKESIVKW